MSVHGIMKNYRQIHKMDYMLFVSVIKSIYWQKAIISSINNENRFDIKLGFLDLVLPPKGPLEGKIMVYNRMSHKDYIPFKNLEIFYKFFRIGSLDLGFTLRGLPIENKF